MANPQFGSTPRTSNADLLRATWAPAARAHAIVKVAAILTFSENITSFTIKKLVDAIRPTAQGHGLMKEEAVQTLLVAFTQGAPPMATSPESAGVAFQDMQGQQAAQSLVITPTSIRFETSTYTRWVAFSQQLSEYLPILLPIVGNSSAVQSVALEYLDQFVAINEGPPDATLVLDRKSDLIAGRAFKKLEPFHCHSGWFEPLGSQSRRLVNVDVNVADAAGPPGIRRMVSIRTHEAEQVINPIDSRAIELATSPTALGVLTGLHGRLKSLIGAVLTQDAQALISLKG